MPFSQVKTRERCILMRALKINSLYLKISKSSFPGPNEGGGGPLGNIYLVPVMIGPLTVK